MTISDFSNYLQQHHRYFFLFAKRLTSSLQDAEDLLQDATMKALQNRTHLNDKSKFQSWFSTVLYHLFVNQYKRKKRRLELLQCNGAHTSFFFNKSKAYNKGLENLQYADLNKITNSIGGKSLLTFRLYLQGYSYNEIAQQKNISIGTVKSRINHARTKMQHLLEAYSKS